MVVTRGYISDERTESVERRLVADFLHTADIHLDLIHGDVPRSFDHYLHVALPRPPGELAECIELSELRTVAGISDASGAQAVAEGDGDVVVAKDLEDVVESLIERILLAA